MKSSLSKLRRIALHNHKGDGKYKRSVQSLANFDELTQAAKDMQQMRNCYDSLLSAAAATVNSAYEFSESLHEIGGCLLAYTPLHDNSESSKLTSDLCSSTPKKSKRVELGHNDGCFPMTAGSVLVMLGNVQLELQKLVDSYRSHVVTTITKPSESLLNELQTVEEMKRQCDEKRDVYQYLIEQQREKGKSKSGKGESITSHELLAAYEEYNEEANLCVFRLKSLKQGQSRSLLTQAARHHTAQLSLFRKGLKSLETIDPHVRHVSAQQHIDYLLSGPKEYDADDGNEGENNYDANKAGELSFSSKSNEEDGDVSTSQNKMEVHFDKYKGESKVSIREQICSHSAPLISQKKFDIAEKAKQLKMSAAKKSNTYVLPKPNDVKETGLPRPSVSAPKKHVSPNFLNLWHSSPLEEKNDEKDSVDNRLQESDNRKARSLVRESNSDATSMQLPLPSADGLSLPRIDNSNASDTKMTKRQAFSDPLSSKPLSGRNVPSTSGPIESTVLQQEVSGAFSRVSLCRPSSPKVSPSSSPLVSSPKISELHELPRPPGDPTVKSVKISSYVGHSAPLVSRNQEFSVANKIPILASSAAAPLPTPPLTVTRSFSIPSSSQRVMGIYAEKLLDAAKTQHKVEEFSSPPLTPISITNMEQFSKISELPSHSGEIQGGSYISYTLEHSGKFRLPA